MDAVAGGIAAGAAVAGAAFKAYKIRKQQDKDLKEINKKVRDKEAELAALTEILNQDKNYLKDLYNNVNESFISLKSNLDTKFEGMRDTLNHMHLENISSNDLSNINNIEDNEMDNKVKLARRTNDIKTTIKNKARENIAKVDDESNSMRYNIDNIKEFSQKAEERLNELKNMVNFI